MKFTPQEEQTLEALCNCLIPPDDYPGAWEAGVGEYIVRLLNTDAKHLQEAYRLGLAGLEAEAQARHKQPFTALSPAEQQSLLERVEQGEVQALWIVHAPTIFNTWLHHTAEGYYSDPGNGGNRNALSWEMIGFETRQTA